jgi:hypothetical protein
MSSETFTTPVQVYAHRERLGQVALVGTMHIAQPSYYETVNSLINEVTDGGGIIHYEGIHTPTSEELEEAAPLNRMKAQSLSRSTRQLNQSTNGLDGLIHQRHAIHSRPKWLCSDVSTLDLARLVGDKTVIDIAKETQLAASRERIGRSIWLGRGGNMQEYTSHLAHELMGILNGSANTDSAMDRMATATAPHREERQLAAIDAYTVDRPDIGQTAIWGNLHLPRMGYGLLQRGYTQISQRHLTAIDLAAFPLDDFYL